MRTILSLWLLIALWPLAGRPWTPQSQLLPAPGSPAVADTRTPPVGALGAPALTNPGFECIDGYWDQPGINGMVPRGWTAVLLNDDATNNDPKFGSVQLWMTSGGCDSAPNTWEKLEGVDSLVFQGADVQNPPKPPHEWDAALYQTVPVVSGRAYSVSAWMVSLCGGSDTRSACTDSEGYMNKMVGLDPTGGTNPRAATVTWTSDPRNFTETHWDDLGVAATAQGGSLTVFVRIDNNSSHTGNHAFADAIKLVEAPTTQFVAVPQNSNSSVFLVSWNATLTGDITGIPNSKHRLYDDLQYRIGTTGAWKSVLTMSEHGASGSTRTAQIAFPVPSRHFDVYVRVRTHAEQPDEPGGAVPNHRFPGVWTESGPVHINLDPPGPPRAWLPFIRR